MFPLLQTLLLFPDDSGDRESRHPTAQVSPQYLGFHGQFGYGIVVAVAARADERVYHPPHTVPYRPARASTPYVVAVEPNTPFMTETGNNPHTVADHPADATHLPLPSYPNRPCGSPQPVRSRTRAGLSITMAKGIEISLTRHLNQQGGSGKTPIGKSECPHRPRSVTETASMPRRE